MRSLHKCSLSVSRYERTSEGGNGQQQTSHLFFLCHFRFDVLTDEKENKIMLDLVSLAQNDAWPSSGLKVKKNLGEDVKGMRQEEVTGCDVQEVITSETVGLWKMRQRGVLISSTCHPEGFSSLWERDKCIRETKAGRVTQTTKLIWCETKEQQEARVSTSYTS